MKRLALATCLLVCAASANALLALRPQSRIEPPSGQAQVDLGGHRLAVPRALIRDPIQMEGGRLDRLDLVMRPLDYAPLPPVDARKPEAAPPAHLSIALTPADESLSAIDMFGKVYARFLSGEAAQGPAGLMLRRFRDKTPYDDRELYLGVGTGKTFVALCPLPESQAGEPCSTRFRYIGLDMELRFPASHLPQWRRMSEHAFALLAEMTREQMEANRVPLPPESD